MCLKAWNAGARGTFLGSAWGPFQDVKKVWAEFFESKPYKSHALGIAGAGHPHMLTIAIATAAKGNLTCVLSAAQQSPSLSTLRSVWHFVLIGRQVA